MLQNYLNECMYFTATRLSRVITKVVEEEFAKCGLSPTSAFLILAVIEDEGISQKKLGEILHHQPSTVTRLIEKLVVKGYLYNRVEGRMSLIYTTDKGKALEPVIHECWNNLRLWTYDKLGDQEADEMTARLLAISERLEAK
ncbi:MarR family winged helix-turn-helix transcriptional regulator [Cohnella boryungensis]|uniref:MarR family winged helix-turn-helix transcriptional regulator n=1 Tax=Cohnella boryungensis TaxID=768479 RepID=A0ABV8S818_9BACL